VSLSGKPRGRPRWALWTLVLALLIFMAWFALIGPLPAVPQFGAWSDKALHVGAFGLLAMLVALPRPAPRALLVLVLCAGVVELVQLAFPLREASLADLAASLVGVVAGWATGAAARMIIGVIGRAFQSTFHVH